MIFFYHALIRENEKNNYNLFEVLIFYSYNMKNKTIRNSYVNISEKRGGRKNRKKFAFLSVLILFY
jgi:hypothetical protein